jgi:hypothetical protein
MKNLIRLEEVAMLILSIYLFSLLPFAWWWYLALILAPDISFLGYAAGNKVGAVVYNLFHHKGVAIAVYIAGLYFHQEVLQLIGLILFGHSSMDRFFGYGLKYFSGFKDTHLGQIGK